MAAMAAIIFYLEQKGTLFESLVFNPYTVLVLSKKSYSMINPTVLVLLFLNFLSPSPTTDPPADLEINAVKKIKPVEDTLGRFSVNKIIPEEIRKITLIALSHYPELMNVEIDFQFQKKISAVARCAGSRP